MQQCNNEYKTNIFLKFPSNLTVAYIDELKEFFKIQINQPLNKVCTNKI